jgi:hypothetical protein
MLPTSDPGRWTGTLNGIASYFNAAVAAIFTHRGARNHALTGSGRAS